MCKKSFARSRNRGQNATWKTGQQPIADHEDHVVHPVLRGPILPQGGHEHDARPIPPSGSGGDGFHMTQMKVSSVQFREQIRTLEEAEK